MVNLSKKYVIGTHVMWFEIEMYADFIKGMVNLLETVENKENVTIDLCFNMLQHFEKVDKDKIKKHELYIKFKRLAEYTDEQDIHRYLLSFSDRKMWDASWDSLVHVDYRDIEFVDDDKGHLNPNQAKSPMSIEKMNEINSRVDDFDFSYITHPKLSGACLVLSSDFIKSGINIPSCLLYNDDEGLSIMSHKLLGQNYLQFVCQNILHVHARRHPQKRVYVKDEDNPYSFINQKNDSFQEFLKLSKENIDKLISGKGKFKEYDDLKKILESK